MAMTDQAEGDAQKTDVRYRHVLVPLDGSELAEGAVPTARALATRFGAELHSVSVAQNTNEAGRLGSQAAAALGVGVRDDRVGVVVGSDTVTEIERRTQELGSCLVCLSTHGRGRVAGAVVGSVARSLLQQSDEPLVAVGPAADRAPSFVSDWPAPVSVDHIVACVDGSAGSEAILPVAAAWATTLGMRLTILTVAEPKLPPIRPEVGIRRRFGPDGDAEEYLKMLAARWEAAAPEVATSVAYDPIGPASGLQRHLDEHRAGLIALTTNARTGLRRVVLGAAAASMIHASVVPAIVVSVGRHPDGGGKAPGKKGRR